MVLAIEAGPFTGKVPKGFTKVDVAARKAVVGSLSLFSPSSSIQVLQLGLSVDCCSDAVMPVALVPSKHRDIQIQLPIMA